MREGGEVVKRKYSVVIEPTKSAYEIVDGYVWCDRTGGVHVDSLNPYDYDEAHHCLPEDHSPIFRAVEAKGET